MYSGPGTGLWTSPNQFSNAPAGSLKVADNVVYTAPTVIEPRRGFSVLADDSEGGIPATFGQTGSLADAIAFFGEAILLAYDFTKIAYRFGEAFADFTGDFVPNGSNRMRFEPAARSMFFNPADGIRFIDTLTGMTPEPKRAGNPQGLNITVANNSDDGWQSPDTAVAYRFTVCSKDFWGRVIEGPPSGRTVLRNVMKVAPGFLVHAGGGSQIVTATAVNGAQTPHNLQIGDVVTLAPGETFFAAGDYTVATVPTPYTFTYDDGVPQASSKFNALEQEFSATRSADVTLWFGPGSGAQEVTESNFLRAYRSEQTLAADDTPSDELFQCYESAYLSSSDLTNGYLTFQDVAPESVLEVPLYTNPNTGDGTLAANFQPPIAEDIAYWQNRMWYFNTTSKHSAEIDLIGVGSPDGLQSGDTITIAPSDGSQEQTYEAGAVTAGTEFELFEDADPGYNIQRTAQALVQTINNNPDNDRFLAFYISSETGTPGRILIVARLFGDTDGAFSLFSSRSTPWTPQLPTFVSPAFAQLDSTNNRHAARLWYSKLGQPEAVPLLNYEQINADNAAGLRIFPLGHRLIVFKTDGIYFVPDSLPVTYEKWSDCVLIAPDSIAEMNDTLYCLTDQGVMAIDDAGVHPVSTSIDDTLTALGGITSLQDLKERCVGVTYRTARQYLLWLIEKDDAGNFSDDNTQAYVRSTLSNGYTRFTYGIRCGVVDPATDQLYVAPTDSNVIWVENKTLTDADYVDADGSAIECAVVFNEFTDGEPATMKTAQQCSFLFKENGINTVTATFASEIHPDREEVELTMPGWGSFPWGDASWGGVRPLRRVEPLPPAVAKCCQLEVGFTTAQVGAKFAFLGVDVVAKRDTVANYG